MQSSDIMTLKQTAKYLKLNEKVLGRYLREGKVPGKKIGKQWRILKKDIDNWLSKGNQNATGILNDSGTATYVPYREENSTVLETIEINSLVGYEQNLDMKILEKSRKKEAMILRKNWNKDKWYKATKDLMKLKSRTIKDPIKWQREQRDDRVLPVD